MQHFSIKWFDILNLHLVSIILPRTSKIILHVSHSESSITKHELNKLLVHLANDLKLYWLCTAWASFSYVCTIVHYLGVHLSFWQIIRNLFQTSLLKIYSRKFSWMCCTLCSSATKHNRQFCLIKWIGLLTNFVLL